MSVGRAVRPAKLHNSLYRNLAQDTSDGFGTFIWNFIILGMTSCGVAAVISFSIYFILLLLIPVSLTAFSISFFKNTEPLARYDKTLYDKAYGQVASIREADSFEDAKELATNIWKHEQNMGKIGENHDNKWHCEACAQRLELIIDIKNNQPIPEVDGSDIERIEQKLKARKELAA